jgi:tetratricopeptide (TPR) repeat protein
MSDAGHALRLYERAYALNQWDALLLGNMGAAMLELGRPRDAFRCYRRALRVDAHDVNARYNAAELLLAQGKRRGLAALLADTPPDALEDEGLRGLLEEAGM